MKYSWIRMGMVGMLGLFAATSAWAHEEGCHKISGEKVSDETAYKDKEACEKAGFQWKHYHFSAHCHKKGTSDSSGHVSASDEKGCLAQGGEWVTHHEKVAE